MPPIRNTGRNRKAPPPGFEDIEDTLLEFSNKMKDAQSAPHEGKKKHETLWPIMQISHQRKLYFYKTLRPSVPPSLPPPSLSETSSKHSASPKLTRWIEETRLPLHLRPVLQPLRHLEAAVRLPHQEQLRRRGADGQVEEAGL